MKWVSVPQPSAYYLLHPKSGPLGVRGHGNSSQRNGLRVKTQQTRICHQPYKVLLIPTVKSPIWAGEQKHPFSAFIPEVEGHRSSYPPAYSPDATWVETVQTVPEGPLLPPFRTGTSSHLCCAESLLLVARSLFIQDHSLGIASLVAIVYAVTPWFPELFFYF